MLSRAANGIALKPSLLGYHAMCSVWPSLRTRLTHFLGKAYRYTWHWLSGGATRLYSCFDQLQIVVYSRDATYGNNKVYISIRSIRYATTTTTQSVKT